MTTYYKAVRPDGTDFYTGTVQWAPPEGHEGEWIVHHPTAMEVGRHPSEYLSVSTVATDCASMKWPCRLLTVEAVGDVTTPSQRMPHNRAGLAFRVTGELPAHEALGPQGAHVAALIERVRHLTPDDASDAAWEAARNAARTAARSAARNAAWDAARNAARTAARSAARNAAWDAARNAAWDAAWDIACVAARNAALNAAGALVVRDLITADQYEVLTRTWRTAVGPIHPDDPELPTERSAA